MDEIFDAYLLLVSATMVERRLAHANAILLPCINPSAYICFHANFSCL